MVVVTLVVVRSRNGRAYIAFIGWLGKHVGWLKEQPPATTLSHHSHHFEQTIFSTLVFQRSSPTSLNCFAVAAGLVMLGVWWWLGVVWCGVWC